MSLIKRSYEKQENSLDGKNFVCRKLYGEYLDKNPFRYGYDINKATENLESNGKLLIKTFIEKNKKKRRNFRKRRTRNIVQKTWKK